MDQPGPEIMAQRNFMHFSSLGRGSQAGLELGEPCGSKLLMRQSYERPFVQEATPGETIHYLLGRVAGPSLGETGDDEMDHENQGRGGRVQSQDSLKFREGRTFDAGIEHRRIKRLFAGKVFVK